jgi:putative MATE family efflux protein
MIIDQNRFKTISKIAIPIVIGMSAQNLFTLVDTAMVGNLGPKAIAAVGTAGMMTFTFSSLVFGVGSGVQAIAARLVGEGKRDQTAIALNAGIIYAVFCSIFITTLAFAVSKPMFVMLCGDLEVAKLANEYFLIRMSVNFIALSNFAFRGYWNAIDKSKIYMNSLLLMNLLNIFLNYLLIFGNWGFPKLGVNGSALATTISTVIGSVFYFVIAFSQYRKQGFCKRLPTAKEFGILSKISFFSSTETFVTMLNWSCMFWIAGQINSYALAGVNILTNMMLFVYLPAVALGMTLATLSGQALGRGDKEDAYLWGLDMFKLGMILCGMLGLPYLFFPESILKIFTNSPELIAETVGPTRLMGVTLCLEMLAVIFLDALKGVGYAKKPMIISACLQWLFFIPIAAYLVLVLKQNLLSVWITQCVMNLIMSFWFYRIWQSRKWQKAL